MTSTVITLSPEIQQRLAIGHDENGTPVKNWDITTLAGAGALRSSVNDLLIFITANLGLTETDLASAIGQTHQIKATTDRFNLNIALGWLIQKDNDTQIMWHNGATGGYRTFIGFDKKRERGVVVLSNSTNNSIDSLGFYLLEGKF